MLRFAHACLGVLLLVSGNAQAHSFGKLYTLPVPLWMYTWGASATLILSFLMVGWFLRAHQADRPPVTRDLSRTSIGRWLTGPFVVCMKALSLLGLMLCIATGLFGTADAFLNFNMTFFWIIFLLGFSYFTALFGGLFSVINPWLTLANLLKHFFSSGLSGRLRYPQKLGCWPALVFYLLFIWIELFAGPDPAMLAYCLVGYTVMNLLGCWLIGTRDWFRYAEFFSVLFRLISKMAPLQYQPAEQQGERGTLTLQMPFSGLLQSRPGSLSELLFVLFILSSTAFDGLHQTDFWARLYWQDIAGWLQPWTGSNIVQAYPILKPLHQFFQSASLLISPFLYLALYLACIGLMKSLTRYPLSWHELALRFAYSLLPIALVYHITHYYTLILTQGAMILRLASDPFGFGWNLFGTAHWLPTPIIPDMDWVWHTQVWLILLGHIISVYLAHREALSIFPERRMAILSQIPMLILMVAFTCFGLWIIAQPITSTVVPLNY